MGVGSVLATVIGRRKWLIPGRPLDEPALTRPWLARPGPPCRAARSRPRCRAARPLLPPSQAASQPAPRPAARPPRLPRTGWRTSRKPPGCGPPPAAPRPQAACLLCWGPAGGRGGDASAPGLPSPRPGGGPGADASLADHRGGAEPKPDGAAVPPDRRPGPPDRQPGSGGWFDRLASTPPDRGPSCGLDILSPRPSRADNLVAAPPSGRGRLITGTSGQVLSPDGPPVIPWRRLPRCYPLAGSVAGPPRAARPPAANRGTGQHHRRRGTEVPAAAAGQAGPGTGACRAAVAAAAIRGYGRPAMPAAALAARVL
jgi:hypothetical protein